MSAVLVIAGSDSSGGAGVVRDVRTLADLGVRALCAVTAVTAQTDAALLATHVVPEAVVRAQIAAAFATTAVTAVKIGMLATAASVRAVSECLAPHAHLPVVLDPVLVSSSGGGLLDLAGRERLVAELLPRAALVTPNLPEAALLLGVSPARDEAAALEQAEELLRRGARAVLLKGGHAGGPESVDLLFARGVPTKRLSAPRIRAQLRGSGCALASAIAAYLAQQVPLAEACARAKNYVTGLLQQAAAASVAS
ncbi:MAG TPA: bifunctional hydroxymethylpyrimidine kinase/phosphomethylpyrimidine kinase [Steroidobacteraceae bacterium]|nr:bifunctional hydroxymethylpyrimidine kinase/phosphomethylpyrimidine kinase [Steroidobacteraceae bacterium]